MYFIERVPLDELNDKNVFKHYINHFPVFNQESATTKCRRVFDASLHKRGKACLNDKMLKGSQLTPHILKVLLRTRLIKNLVTLDISKAFLRMVLKLSDRNFTCFFFRDNINDPNSPISVWRFKSVLFGATSPFMLNCTVADILRSNEFPFNLEVFEDNLTKCPNLTFDQMCPILIPAKSLYTNLVIAHNHVNSGHMSIHNTRSKLRNRYWIPKDTPIIKSVLKKCQVCFDQRGQRYHVPDSPDLPEFRFDSKNPWKTTFLDMTGHYFVKDKYGNAEKVYFIVFVCASTGSGHIEIAMNASAEAFAYSFERFCSKNALPFKIVSVQGSNVGAFNVELKIISGEITKNWVLIKDNSKDFCIGKGFELIKSDDGVIRQTILKTEHYEGVYPISNFRFLKCQPKSKMVDYQIIPKVQYRPEKQTGTVVNVNEIWLDGSIEFHPINLVLGLLY